MLIVLASCCGSIATHITCNEVVQTVVPDSSYDFEDIFDMPVDPDELKSEQQAYVPETPFQAMVRRCVMRVGLTLLMCKEYARQGLEYLLSSQLVHHILVSGCIHETH